MSSQITCIIHTVKETMMSAYLSTQAQLGLGKEETPGEETPVVSKIVEELKADIQRIQETSPPDDNQQMVNLPPNTVTMAATTENFLALGNASPAIRVIQSEKIAQSDASGVFGSQSYLYESGHGVVDRMNALKKEILSSATIAEIDSLAYAVERDKIQAIMRVFFSTNIVRQRGQSKTSINSSLMLHYAKTVNTPVDVIKLLSLATSGKDDWRAVFRIVMAEDKPIMQALRRITNLLDSDISDQQFLFAIRDKELLFMLAAWLGVGFEETRTLYQEKNGDGVEELVQCPDAYTPPTESQIEQVRQAMSNAAIATIWDNVKNIVRSTSTNLVHLLEKPAEIRASARKEKKKKVLGDYKKSMAYKLISSFKAK